MASTPTATALPATVAATGRLVIRGTIRVVAPTATKVGALLLLATVASAQPVVNPRTVEFAPSADHDAVLPADLGGGPVVASYEARYYVVGGTTPICAVSLGKPTPVSSLISLPLPLSCVPVSWGTRYEVRVAALGPTGTGISGPSGPFASVSEPAAPGVPAVRR